MSTRNTGSCRHRQWSGAAIVVAAGVVSVASTAFACTQFMFGSLTLNPTSGPRGTVVTAKGSGLSDGASTTYTLRLADSVQLASGIGCHDSPKVLAAGVPTIAGAFKVKVTIPPKPTAKGKAKVCGTDDQNGLWGTFHKTFTIL